MHYNLNLLVTVKIDVFNYVVIEVMFQQNDNEQLKSVIYFSFKMLFAKCNYEIYDKKLLIIIRAFEKWRLELKDTLNLVEIIFNHKNLEYFMLIKLFSWRQVRWSEFLSWFNFKIVYHSSELNTWVNAFTRRSEDFFLNEKNSHQWQIVLKTKNLKIQVLINVFNDSDSEALESSDLKSESVISKQSESSKKMFMSEAFKSSDSKSKSVISEQSESSEKMFMNELKKQLFAVYFNDEWVQIMITALRDDQWKLKEFSLAKCMLQND